MVHASFEIHNSLQFFQMFKAYANEFIQDHSSSRKAIVSCILGYHLREWIWKDYSPIITQILRINKECDFNKHINDSFKYFKILKDVCNGSKHFQTIKGTGRHDLELIDCSFMGNGDFNQKAFSFGYNIPTLTIKFNGNKVLAGGMIQILIKYYEDLFKTLGVS